MTYNEIIKLDDAEEKQKAFIDYYINDVKVLDWLYDNNNYQHIIFNDREEYKYDNKYHRLDGPAIIHKNGTELYYINGEIMSKADWEIKIK